MQYLLLFFFNFGWKGLVSIFKVQPVGSHHKEIIKQRWMKIEMNLYLQPKQFSTLSSASFGGFVASSFAFISEIDWSSLFTGL